MIELLLLLFPASLQGEDVRVATHIAEKDYDAALSVAFSAADGEKAVLETWVRHQAGDLAGALASARSGLLDAPEDLRLLEQAAYICGSLMLAEESLDYSERMLALGDSRGAALREHALQLMAERGEVQRSVLLSYGVIAAAALALTLVGWHASSFRAAPESLSDSL